MAALTPATPDDPEGPKVAPSFSGGERNRMYLRKDSNYLDVTLVSGADFREDGRGFAILDFDEDGFDDFVVMSPGEPKLRLVRNQTGAHAGPDESHYLNVTLVGGSRSAESQQQWSSRDAFGAELLVESGGKLRRFQHACSEGLSVQNTKWIHIGLGSDVQVDRLQVMWPSGRKTVLKNVAADQWLSVSERQ